ncbi:hypothetical protein L915_16973, partial [Phytophthora nicotianae]
LTFILQKMDNSPPKKKKKKQRSYSVRKKRDAVRRIQEVGVEEVARELQCVRGTAHGWCQQDDKLLSFTGHATSKTMKRKGRKELFPDVAVIVTFMKVKHRAELALTTRGIMEYMWKIEPDWVTNDMVDKRSRLPALQRVGERLATRHGFTSQ